MRKRFFAGSSLLAAALLVPEAQAQLIGNPTGAFAPIRRGGSFEGLEAVRPFISLDYAFFDRDLEFEDVWTGFDDEGPLQSHFGFVTAGVHVPYFELYGRLGGASMDFTDGSYEEIGWAAGLGARIFFGTPAGRFGLCAQFAYYQTENDDGPEEVGLGTGDIILGYSYPIPLGRECVLLPYVGFGGSFIYGWADYGDQVVVTPSGPIVVDGEFDVEAENPITLLGGVDLHVTSVVSLQAEGRLHGDGFSFAAGIGFTF
ncbi:MAG: hypothetical protein JXP34_10830 [Planctomycetes bacterium]|nr:hypothetical protein [Planctomycetota bacterium]